MNAQSESEVTSILNSFSNQIAWEKYGGDEGNSIATINNQTPKAEASLVEKITNSIDAILIKKCLEHGENPADKSAPKSIEEALKKYFDIEERVYHDMPPAMRRNLAQNIQIIADGGKKDLNLTIYDNGEGQSPERMKSTLLSLGKKNKISIHFVQGKFNMGGSAVLPFCGRNKYQLIVSRRNINNNNATGIYGFTLLRINLGEENDRSSWYEYFVSKDTNEILKFESDPFDAGLYETSFNGGTLIKLFNYDIRKKSNITLDLWRDLNKFLFKPALPILLYEKREYRGNTPTKIMHGNYNRIKIDDSEALSATPFSMDIELKDNDKKIIFPCEVFLFKEDKGKEFTDDMPLVFTNNGQTQNYIGPYFISSKVKRVYLKNSLLINVNCSRIPRVINETLFMSNRATMRDSSLFDDLKENIAKELRENDLLTREDELRRRKVLSHSSIKDESFLKNVVGKLIKSDSEIRKIFDMGQDIVSKSTPSIKTPIDIVPEKFVPNRFPSFFKFKNISSGNVKMCPLNGECRLEIQTDIDNDYLSRPHDQGELKIFVDGVPLHTGNGDIREEGNEAKELLVSRVGPIDGVIKLKIKPGKNISIGDQIPISLELTSPDGNLELYAEIKITKPKIDSPNKKNDDEENLSLPKIKIVRKEKQSDEETSWADTGFTWNETTICHFQDSSNGFLDCIFINMDSRDIINYIRSKKYEGENAERVTKTYKAAIFLSSIMIYHGLLKLARQEKMDASKIEEVASSLMNDLSKILLHITVNDDILNALAED